MALTCAELEARWKEADLALHKLITGGGVQRIRYGEKEVAYSRAKADELALYVAHLANQVAACKGAVPTPRAAIGIVFI